MKTLSQHKQKSQAPKTPETLHVPANIQPINKQIKSQIPSLLTKPQNPSLPQTITLELLHSKPKRKKEVHTDHETLGCYTISTSGNPATFVAWKNGTRKIAFSQNQHTVIIPAHIGDYLAIDILYQSRHHTAIYQADACPKQPSISIHPLTLILNLKHFFNGYTFLPLPPPQELTPLLHSIWRFTEGDTSITYHIPPVPEYHTKRKKLLQ